MKPAVVESRIREGNKTLIAATEVQPQIRLIEVRDYSHAVAQQGLQRLKGLKRLVLVLLLAAKERGHEERGWWKLLGVASNHSLMSAEDRRHGFLCWKLARLIKDHKVELN